VLKSWQTIQKESTVKILHTGDWHIGKLVHGVHMTEDQRYILKQLINLIAEEKPDVLLIAGDLYDRSVPPVEAVDLLDETLSAIVLEHNTKVIVIAGNHDSPDRVGFAGKLLRDNGLYISGKLTKPVQPIILEDAFGPVHFYAIPFTEPVIVKELYGNDAIKSHDTAIEAIINNINEGLDAGTRTVCIAHAFVMGSEALETSESERPLAIGGSEYAGVEHFSRFNYVALGHLHGPQRVKNKHIRYSGSLLKYSFSEATQKKSVALITMDAEGNTDVVLKELPALRDLRVIKGQLENLLDKNVYANTNTDDYIMAIITDRGELIDAISKLRAVYPNILRMEKEQFDREAGTSGSSASSQFAHKNPLELFAEFYENVSGETFSAEKRDHVATIFDEAAQNGRIS